MAQPSESHSDTPHSVRIRDNTQYSQQTDIHAPGGIRTHNPNKQVAAGLCLRLRGHWNRQNLIYVKEHEFRIIRQSTARYWKPSRSVTSSHKNLKAFLFSTTRATCPA